MTPEQFQQLADVNQAINEWPTQTEATLPEPVGYVTDVDIPGHTFVCRSFVVAKSERLQELGWPQSTLTEVICWTEPVGDPPKPERHAVLAVQLPGEQTWILDSRFTGPYLMDHPVRPYQWEGRQLPGTLDFQPIA
jgi:predicted transglutaminase-like cysteine proteinase